MPAGTPRPPRRIPRRLAGLGGLPQHEIERIALGLVDLDARAGAQIVELLARELAVARELAHRVQHVAVVGDVGVALVDQLPDHPDDSGHVLGGARLAIRPGDAERGAVLVALPG